MGATPKAIEVEQLEDVYEDIDPEDDPDADEDEDEDEEPEEPEPEEIPPPAAKRKSRRKRPAKAAARRAAERYVEEADADIASWLEELGGIAPLKIQIIRKHPTMHAGEHVGGHLETVEEIVDQDYLKQRWGGGKLQLYVTRRDHSGKYKYVTARTIEIAGDPLHEGRPIGLPKNPMNLNDPLAERAFDSMESQMQQTQRQLDEIRRQAAQPGVDTGLIQMMQQPLLEQIRTLQNQYMQLQQSYTDKIGEKPPQDPVQEKMLTRLFDEDSARLNAVRAQYDSELRQQRENHYQEMRELRRAHDKELERLQHQHEREVDLIRETYRTQEKVMGSAESIRMETLRNRIDDLQRELSSKDAELQTLRTKKDKSLPDQITELASIRESFDALGMGGNEEKDKKWYETVIDGVMNSQGAVAALERLTTGGAAPEGGQQQLPPHQESPPPQQPPQQSMQPQDGQMLPGEPAPGIPFQVPGDPKIYVRQPDGTLHTVPPEQIRRQQAAAEKRRQQKAARDEGEPSFEDPGDIREPEPDEIEAAIKFMEGAIQNNRDPEQFAQSAASLIPQDVLRYIQKVGVDHFLNHVASSFLEPGSPLTQQHGRNFARQVGKALIGDAP